MKHVTSKLAFGLLFASSVLNGNLDHNLFVENPKIVFFDVSDALIGVNKVKSAYEHFGFFDSVRALFQGNLNDLFTNLLGQIPSPCEETKLNHLNGLGKGQNGNDIPALQRDYLLGKLESQECIEAVEKWVEENKDKFTSDYQRSLFVKMIRFYFDPKTYYDYLSYSDCMNTMKKLFETKTADGKRMNIVFVIANESKEHKEMLQLRFPDIFAYSDMQLFSCEEGMLKSHPDLFEKCFKECPAKSYYFSFLVDKSAVKTDTPLIINNHCMEIISPNEAGKELSSYGALVS